MPSGPSVLHFSKDIAQRLLDLSGWHARTFEFLGIGSDERLNFNRVSDLIRSTGAAFAS